MHTCIYTCTHACYACIHSMHACMLACIYTCTRSARRKNIRDTQDQLNAVLQQCWKNSILVFFTMQIYIYIYICIYVLPWFALVVSARRKNIREAQTRLNTVLQQCWKKQINDRGLRDSRMFVTSWFATSKYIQIKCSWFARCGNM